MNLFTIAQVQYNERERNSLYLLVLSGIKQNAKWYIFGCAFAKAMWLLFSRGEVRNKVNTLMMLLAMVTNLDWSVSIPKGNYRNILSILVYPYSRCCYFAQWQKHQDILPQGNKAKWAFISSTDWNIWHDKQYRRREILSGFHLNGHRLKS